MSLAKLTCSASLADSLKAMDHSTYLLLSTQMFGTMLSRLKSAQQMGEVIQDVLASNKSALWPDDRSPSSRSGMCR
jgi:hypothetical protein